MAAFDPTSKEVKVPNLSAIQPSMFGYTSAAFAALTYEDQIKFLRSLDTVKRLELDVRLFILLNKRQKAALARDYFDKLSVEERELLPSRVLDFFGYGNRPARAMFTMAAEGGVRSTTPQRVRPRRFRLWNGKHDAFAILGGLVFIVAIVGFFAAFGR